MDTYISFRVTPDGDAYHAIFDYARQLGYRTPDAVHSAGSRLCTVYVYCSGSGQELMLQMLMK
jgi:hypothetical protein